MALNVALDGLPHQNFATVVGLIEQKAGDYFAGAVQDVGDALKLLYGGRVVSMQQLAAAFRRGDLIGRLRG